MTDPTPVTQEEQPETMPLTEDFVKVNGSEAMSGNAIEDGETEQCGMVYLGVGARCTNDATYLLLTSTGLLPLCDDHADEDEHYGAHIRLKDGERTYE